jgi:NAD(P)-dependent dehydrogenase (short-subunit alcohol dehydrogenase family)
MSANPIARAEGKSMKKLEGKISVITGATEGLGFATAKRFVEEGSFVFITGRRETELASAKEKLGPNASGILCDSSKLTDLDDLFATIGREKGRLDVLFANAGLGLPQPMGSITEEAFDRVFGINVRGTLFTVQKALPMLSDGASIIMTGSIAGVKAVPAYSVYCASRAAIRSFARTWTAELKGRRIRVNVLSPGTINTNAMSRIPDQTREQIIAATPLGRLGEPDEVAKAALFLASDDSSFITGTELFVDGGAAQI